MALGGVRDAVSTALKNSGIDPRTVNGLDSIFDPLGPYGKLFPGLDTHHLQMKYLRRNFKFVVRHAAVLIKHLIYDFEHLCFEESLSLYHLFPSLPSCGLGTYHSQSWDCTTGKGHRC